MDFSVATLIDIFDRIGIVAFAFSGVETGLRRKLDLFGLIVMGVVTATGGGLMRDVLLARRPLLLDRGDYLHSGRRSRMRPSMWHHGARWQCEDPASASGAR